MNDDNLSASGATNKDGLVAQFSNLECLNSWGTNSETMLRRHLAAQNAVDAWKV